MSDKHSYLDRCRRLINVIFETNRACHGVLIMYTDFDIDSSSRFPFRERTDRRKGHRGRARQSPDNLSPHCTTPTPTSSWECRRFARSGRKDVGVSGELESVSWNVGFTALQRHANRSGGDERHSVELDHETVRDATVPRRPRTTEHLVCVCVDEQTCDILNYILFINQSNIK